MQTSGSDIDDLTNKFYTISLNIHKFTRNDVEKMSDEFETRKIS